MENENAFKNWVNQEVVVKLSSEIKKAYPLFKEANFKEQCNSLDSLELKARVKLIAKNLNTFLPEKYSKALQILMTVVDSEKLSGFELWPISEFISTNGTSELDRSFAALKVLTKYFTSEFAIRPFIISDCNKSLKYLKEWVNDENMHVRRLVSEGSRPMLPWGQKLRVFIEKPELSVSLLNKLKHDDELYVRKSVANHLNDISKFKPDLVIQTLRKWEKTCPEIHSTKIKWIKQHALRTLIKKGDSDALALIGVSKKPLVELENFKLSSNAYDMGDTLNFTLVVRSLSRSRQKIVLDYIVYFKKANGTLSPKVFKLKTFELEPLAQIKIEKNHSLREITTRKYYPGGHGLSVQINGHVRPMRNWTLRIR